MDELHRQTIQRNYSNLVRDCDINTLLPLLVERKVFSREMTDKYTNGSNILEKNRMFFLDISRRGPRAFSDLVWALRETGQHHLANLLDPTSTNLNCSNNTQPKRHAVPFQLPPIEQIAISNPEIQNVYERSAINFSCEPLMISVIGGTRLYDQSLVTYNTHSKNRGLVLIINNIKYINDNQPERKGAKIDGENLRNLFLQMGLQVIYYENLTGAEMEAVIIDFKSTPLIKVVDMVFVVIMGHGNDLNGTTVIIGTDGALLETSWIEERFNNVHSKALQHKPKIIIYQTCRGTYPDRGVIRRVQTDSAARPSTSEIRTISDLLIAHSSVPGFASHRDIYLGTWYINSLCKIMMNEAHALDVESILRQVDLELSRLRTSEGTMQTTMFSNIGFRTCYIHPKIYMQDGVLKNIFNDSVLE